MLIELGSHETLDLIPHSPLYPNQPSPSRKPSSPAPLRRTSSGKSSILIPRDQKEWPLWPSPLPPGSADLQTFRGPRDLNPRPELSQPDEATAPLPRADVLVVTWTVDEGHALSRVLTPGKDSRNDYVPYAHNYAAIASKMSKGCPAVMAKRLGAYWTTTIGSKKVLIFKSDSHLSQDTNHAIPKGNATLPNADVWQQIITEVQPKLVITTGTAGGIGKQCEVGDVVVSPIVRFDCTNG